MDARLRWAGVHNKYPDICTYRPIVALRHYRYSTGAQHTSCLLPKRIQTDFLSLIRMSRKYNSSSQADSNFCKLLTEGANLFQISKIVICISDIRSIYYFRICCSYTVGRTTRRHPATSSRIFFPLHLFSPRSCHRLSTAEHRLSMLFFFSQESIFLLFHPQL